MAANSSLSEKVEKLENKVKLSNLLSGKKFADLELTLGNLEQKFNEITVDLPKLKERSEEIEDLLNIINLGLTEFKRNLDEVKSHLADIEKMPTEISKRMSSYDNRLDLLDENVRKLSENLTGLSTIKEEIYETIRKTVLPELESLKVNSMNSKIEMEHIKRDLETFSTAVKSFERTIELTNVDTMLKRFEALENKIDATQSQMENFKDTLRSLVVFHQKMNDLNLLDTVNELKSSLRNKDIIINEIRARIDDLAARLDRLSSVFNRTLAEAKTSQTSAEETYVKVKELYDKISKEVSELKNIERKIKFPAVEEQDMPNELQNDPPTNANTIYEPASLQTDSSDNFTKLNDRITILERHHNELVDILQKELSNIKNEILKPGEIDDIRKRLNELERIIESRERGLIEYKKQIENRLKNLENKKIEGSLPKDLMKELSFLKEITSRLVTENNEFRRLARDLRVAQLAAVKPEAFAAIADRVLTLEKKISEIEVKGKGPVTQSQALDTTPILNKISNLERRLSEIEEKISKEPVPQTQPENLENFRKEIESLKSIIQEKESHFEEKISKLEKKMSEESISRPFVLE